MKKEGLDSFWSEDMIELFVDKLTKEVFKDDVVTGNEFIKSLSHKQLTILSRAISDELKIRTRGCNYP